MRLSKEIVVAQLSDVLNDYERVDSEYPLDIDRGSLPLYEVTRLKTRAWSAIQRLAPPGTPFRLEGERILSSESHDEWKLRELRGVLMGLRADYLSDAMQGVEELVLGGLLDDFLAMGEHLLEYHYKDAAAVMIGGVLEERLRKLAEREGIPLTLNDQPKKTAVINDDLRKRGTYNLLEHKQVTAWLDIRNNAAHAKYDQYEEEQVRLMATGVRGFVTRYA